MSLQRRRVNKASTSQNKDETTEPDHKVVYDEQEAVLKENTSVPKLTLMEEVLLIGLKDKEGYLSFWNDNISYALRGCILIELALRGKIRCVDDPVRRRFDVSERLIEVIDSSKTGEVLLDESLSLMKNEAPTSIVAWIDLLSGETWNLLKMNYQLKQVRERLAKGLVDKGVLRTEMKNFFLFDMATHPITDTSCKEAIKRRIFSILVSRNAELTSTPDFPENVAFKYIRTLALICGAYGANVLENVLITLDYETRDKGFARADEILAQFSQFPFPLDVQTKTGISVNLNKEVAEELQKYSQTELQLEVVAGVFEVFSRMDTFL